MNFITYLFFRLAVCLFSLLSFKSLYRLSDMLAWVLYRLLRYRYGLIQNNLKRSFPDKTSTEIEAIIQQFYINLSDILLEGIKGISITKDQLLRRYQFLNPELLHDFYKKKQGLFILASHYANWEWGALAFGWQVSQQCIGIYKPLKNPYIDRYIRQSRAKNALILESMYELLSVFKKYQDKASLYVFISDQTPSNSQRAHWLTFLNQDTPCMRGVDSFARRFNYPVLYADCQRLGRGFYQITFYPLHLNPSKAKTNEITTAYMRRLEQIIQKEPANWLWSHNRWKHKLVPSS